MSLDYTEEKKDRGVVFKISGNKLAMCILPFPITAFILCILLSVMNDFEASTATHCRVKNYLPSISSAIGGFTPQRYIWRVCIALHCSPRIMLAVMFYNHFCSFNVKTKPELYRSLAWLASLLHILENLALVILSYVSSSENKDFHENSFVAFVVCSQEKKSYKYKIFLFFFNFSSFMLAVYCYFRHNSYCEPGVYTLFAFCEYLTVLSNIAFHATACFEFGRGRLQFINYEKEDDNDVKLD